MSTQQIRNLVRSQIDSVIVRAKSEVRNEAKKKVTELQQSLPTPKEISKQLLVDIDEDTCSEKGMEKFNKKLNSTLSKINKLQGVTKGALEKIEAIELKIDPILNGEGPVGQISQIQTTLETYIMPILQKVIFAVPIAMGVLKGLAADVQLGFHLGERKKKAESKVKEYISLVVALPGMISFYQDKAKKAVSPIYPAKNKLSFIDEEITKTKAYIIALQLRFEEGCAALSAASNTSDGITDPTDPTDTALDNYLLLLEQQYQDVYQTLKDAGDEKALKRVFALKETLEEDFNISFKIINLND